MKAVMDRVLIKLDESKKQEGGVLLPDDFLKARTVGVVLSIGPQVKSVKVGQRVIFHAFDELPTIESDVVALRENSLLAVLEEKEEKGDKTWVGKK